MTDGMLARHGMSYCDVASNLQAFHFFLILMVCLFPNNPASCLEIDSVWEFVWGFFVYFFFSIHS